nr:homoserine kinase-like [Ipomoea batatas]
MRIEGGRACRSACNRSRPRNIVAPACTPRRLCRRVLLRRVNAFIFTNRTNSVANISGTTTSAASKIEVSNQVPNLCPKCKIAYKEASSRLRGPRDLTVARILSVSDLVFAGLESESMVSGYHADNVEPSIMGGKGMEIGKRMVEAFIQEGNLKALAMVETLSAVLPDHDAA